MNPLVAIVGRPNVGKSTLFNRLAGRRLAIVQDVPGVTRDRHYADVEWEGRALTLIDTGGFVPGEVGELLRAVRDQAQLAVEECDVLCFVVDGREGLTAADQEVARQLRRSGKPLILAVNKLDDPRHADELTADFHRLGMGDPLATSAEHNLGITGLVERISGALPPPKPQPEEPAAPGEEPIRVAIVGRPNVGKSTLVNALLKQKRLVASEVPGTTVDPIDSAVQLGDRHFILTDTAGIRRKSAIAQKVEAFAVVAALRAVDRSDVAVVLLDATEPGVDQDARLAGIAEEKGRALILVVNKWDKIHGESQKALRDELKYRFKFVAYAPVVFTSALTGSKVEKVLELAGQLYGQAHFRAPTPRLNKLLQSLEDSHPPPIVGGKPLRLYYIAQVGTAPPAFALTTNRPGQVPESYQRYLVNHLREAFDLRVPIRLFFRERPGQAKRAARKRPR